MRRKSSEINVFSMSALDLFASALGAFILLAVIFLPFFPNTGDHPAVSEAIMKRLAAAEAMVADLQSAVDRKNTQIATLEKQNSDLQRDLAEAQSSIKFPDVDIVIVLDSTGSMRDPIDGLKQEISQFARLMLELSPSVGIGVVEFKDRCDGVPIRAFDLVEMNATSISSLQSFADSIEAGGDGCNQDGPEALKDGLSRAVGMNWRAEAKVRLIVVVTDNPAYPEEQSEAISIAASFAARGPGYSVGAAQVDFDPDAREFLQKLADAGNGELVSGGGSFTTTILLSLAGI